MSNHYFQNDSRAASYDLARPSFHNEALECFHQSSPKLIYQRALDVGCGTGQASLALTKWASEVFAVDNSEAMLKHAQIHQAIHYQLAAAEALPFDDKGFDLAFVASSLHWFKRRAFLKEMSRVLSDQGKLLIYSSKLFDGVSVEFFHEFEARFPRPYKEVQLVNEELQIFGFSPQKKYMYVFETEDFTDEMALNYFMSLSNIAVQIHDGKDEALLRKEVQDMMHKHATGLDFKVRVNLTEVNKI